MIGTCEAGCLANLVAVRDTLTLTSPVCQVKGSGEESRLQSYIRSVGGEGSLLASMVFADGALSDVRTLSSSVSSLTRRGLIYFRHCFTCAIAG